MIQEGLNLMNNTIDYYNQNTDEFIESTVSVDFSETQDRFLSKIKRGASILDFGCGSGRDTKYFLERGYHVTAVDGSEKLCKFASDYTGIEVKQMLFQELNDIEIYDGIWACSSILHLPYDELKVVMKKIAGALKNEGILYTSFKYGTVSGYRNGRYFTNMTEVELQQMLDELECFDLVEYWITTDVRPGRETEKWLNMLLCKKA